MRALVCMATAILFALSAITLWANVCDTCCDGQPCRPQPPSESTP